MRKLCAKCLAFQNWDLPQVQRWSGALFSHHETGSVLVKAASDGCHLCNLLQRALLERAKRPEGDTKIPDRQIWLECCEPDGDVLTVRLNVTVEPESLASAGCRDINGSKRTIAMLSNTELDDETREMMKGGGTFGQAFYAIGTKAGTRFFYDQTEIYDDDLFFALANSYWEASVDFVNMLDRTSQMLEACSEFEDSGTGSRASFTLISGWLNECVENHPQCRICTEEKPLLPTRIIDVGNLPDSTEPHLVITQPDQRGRYVALSHRWGSTKPLTTTHDTLLARQDEISESEISQTFIDAMQVCKELGLQFLWIDSLCIVQDDPEDWSREASRMAAIYRNAFVIIAAVDTEDDNSGLFSARNGLQNRPCKFELDPSPATFLRRDIVHIVIPEMKYDDIFRPRGPLDARGWVLQEQLLSTRVINFKREGVYWECLTSECSESAPEGLSAMSDEAFMKDGDYIRIFKKGIAGLLNLTTPEFCEKFFRAWLLIVQAYSRRSLTKETDKIAAIFGIVDEVSQRTNDSFLMAPSGSWLGIQGTIRYIESYIDEADLGEVISECHLFLEKPDKPSELASFSGTQFILKVTGPVRKAIPFSIRDESRMMQAASTILTAEFIDIIMPNSKANLAPRSGRMPYEPEEPKTWREAHQYFRILNRKEFAFVRSTDTRDETEVLISNHALEDAVFRDSAKIGPKYHADFYNDMCEDSAKASLQYMLFTFSGKFKHVGFWAPDVAGEIPAVRGEQMKPDYEGPRPQFIEIHFIAISKANGYVRALGIVPLEEKESHFLRVGMGWWSEDEWDRGEAEVMECIIV